VTADPSLTDSADASCSTTALLRGSCYYVKRFRGGLVFKAHRLVYHSTLGLRVIQKKKAGNDLVEGVAVSEVDRALDVLV